MKRTPYERRYDLLRRRVDRHLASLITPGSPRALRDACAYVLSGGGKRLRAILVLLGCEAVGGSAAQALHAAAAVEIMHNFTLVHDDIMDHAPTRRGRPTVHVRWDLNTALLAGDTLLAIAYENLLRTRHADQTVLTHLFTQSVIGVCEGQALDLEFEQRRNVRVADYFTMIEQKTGRLIAVATELGGRIGGGTPDTGSAPSGVRASSRDERSSCRTICSMSSAMSGNSAKRSAATSSRGSGPICCCAHVNAHAGADRTVLDRVMRRKTSPPRHGDRRTAAGTRHPGPHAL